MRPKCRRRARSKRSPSDYQRFGWQEAVGSSGSAQEIANLLEMNGLNPDGVSGISREGLIRLRQLLIRAGSAEALDLKGLRSDRFTILPGAVAIMSAVFSELGMAHMTYSDGALPLGVLYDLLGRFEHHDTRDETVVPVHASLPGRQSAGHPRRATAWPCSDR
jgi:exopolyphosphatase/guanosine-5'-triphosphate,3'-diphosphate pyrophosphatase